MTVDVPLSLTASLSAALVSARSKKARFGHFGANRGHVEPCEGREPRHEGV